MTKILVTGGCGFMGHHFIEHLFKNTDWDVYVIDKMTYASSGADRLRDLKLDLRGREFKVFAADFSSPISEGVNKELSNLDYIVHIGAETHVDNSIINPEPFVRSNVLGTMYLLDLARMQKKLKYFLYFSTDEVFGPLKFYDSVFKEWDRYNSTNPYAATKAGAEELCLAYANTYNLPIIITHCMNLFGERQHPEKYIPLCINKILKGEKVYIHSDPGKTRPGTRFYIHCRDASDGLLFLLQQKNLFREKFNIVGQKEIDNLSLAKMIAKFLDKPLNYELIDFHSSRPGHDLRYGLNGEKMAQMGWKPPLGIEESLKKTIHWYLNNPKWLDWRRE